MKCRNCGEEIRQVQPGDGIDPRDYRWVHVFPLASGGEIIGLFCDITLTAEPPAGEHASG